MPNGRCRIHGGLTPTGPSAGAYRTGRYSKLLPARLAGRYKEAQADPDLLAMRDEIALLDARLGDVLGNMDTGESGSVWQRLKATNEELKVAVITGKTTKVTQHARELSAIVDAGATDLEAWGDVYGLLEQRRRLVESERKRLVDMQQMITTEKAMTLLGVILETIQTHVTDRAILTAISADFRKLISIDPG